MINESREILLLGGGTASEIVKIHNTVRRPIGPHSEFCHKLLKLLERERFDYAPRFLGIDEKGREILTFIEGKVPHREIKWTDKQLIKIVGIIKEFHDATAGSELAGEKEVVCHNDIAPWNTVVDDNIPIALIDFDDAMPGNRIDDFAYFLWTFLEIGSDIPANIQAAKIRKLYEAYGPIDGKIIDAILEQQEKILAKREMLAKNAKSQESREFSASRVIKIRLETEWVKKNRKALESVF